ncbi:pyrroline-5-carboxylate reductase [Maridesulfovibrio ferrireducens]|uniref:pyrroline-5-carboxylate reductase n=1 Tax=Maridesulfovibrio ferrireducens TaxID=246191 RepID=UPI001A19F177|nr:pyrroline-5-carboxylate reductase [Maridesulfovibrio ferrireducens]MBI9113307.1 pyrroline-5-carboxylate reductase [Maridesulfovibrio ferrireducens]
MKIGFIGIGNMGGPIIRTLSEVADITIYGLNQTREKLEKLAQETDLIPCKNVQELTEKSDFIVLAVKPQQADGIWPEMIPALTKDKCLISIAAGLTLKSLKNSTQNICPVVRAMPNTPVLIKEGVTAICLDDEIISEQKKKLIQNVFRNLGDVHVLPENQFDVFTALIGSGPAYIFYLIETMIESGVELGLHRDVSSRMVKKLFRGSSLMAEQSKEHVSMIKEMSIAPAGTTIAALVHFDRTAIRGNIMDAIRMAYTRSIELG